MRSGVCCLSFLCVVSLPLLGQQPRNAGEAAERVASETFSGLGDFAPVRLIEDADGQRLRFVGESLVAGRPWLEEGDDGDSARACLVSEARLAPGLPRPIAEHPDADGELVVCALNSRAGSSMLAAQQGPTIFVQIRGLEVGNEPGSLFRAEFVRLAAEAEFVDARRRINRGLSELGRWCEELSFPYDFDMPSNFAGQSVRPEPVYLHDQNEASCVVLLGSAAVPIDALSPAQRRSYEENFGRPAAHQVEIRVSVAMLHDGLEAGCTHGGHLYDAAQDVWRPRHRGESLSWQGLAAEASNHAKSIGMPVVALDSPAMVGAFPFAHTTFASAIHGFRVFDPQRRLVIAVYRRIFDPTIGEAAAPTPAQQALDGEALDLLEQMVRRLGRRP